MFLMIAPFIAIIIQNFFAVSQAKRVAPRVFAEGYIEGLYGRIFEYTKDGASSPCPRVIDHFNRGVPSAGDSWIVPHGMILQNGVSCNDRGVLVLESYNYTSAMPDRLKPNPVAVETFSHMKRDSTGFWMGTDARTCGAWVFPDPSFVFFVKEFDRAITTSFRLRLEAGQKYMFVVAPEFTCIYLDIPRRSPNPDVILMPGDGSSPLGENGTVATPTPTSSDVTQAENSTGNEQPSQSIEDGGNVSTDDSDISIIDIQVGATSPPIQTPRPGTIQDIYEDENEDAGDPITAILNEDVLGEHASETSTFSDPTTQAGDSLCFPGAETVELANGRIIRMDELAIGDEIRIGDEYSRVFAFTHKDPYARKNFIRLTTRSGKSITLSTGHYLYANNRLIPAKEVGLGDKLHLVNGDGTVERVEAVIRSGLYNPQTLHGDVAVNGVVTSCYTTAVSKWSAHALLTPLRAAWRALPLGMTSFLQGGCRNYELAGWWASVSYLKL